MALHAKIARALDRFDGLVHMLVTFIALAEREFRTFLDIYDD